LAWHEPTVGGVQIQSYATWPANLFRRYNALEHANATALASNRREHRLTPTEQSGVRLINLEVREERIGQGKELITVVNDCTDRRHS
jgi:hypothetical protein